MEVQIKPSKSTAKEREEYIQNLFKLHLAVLITKEGIEEFVECTFRKYHAELLHKACQQQNLPSGTTCGSCTTSNVVPCFTQGFCYGWRGRCRVHNDRQHPDNMNKKCPVSMCNYIQQSITRCHSLGKPAWRNTDATKWCVDYFEIFKCFLPPQRIRHASSLQSVDLHSIVYAIYHSDANLKHQGLSELLNVLNCANHSLDVTASMVEMAIDQFCGLLQYYQNKEGQLTKDTKESCALNKLGKLKKDVHSVVNEEALKLLLRREPFEESKKPVPLDDSETTDKQPERYTHRLQHMACMITILPQKDYISQDELDEIEERSKDVTELEYLETEKVFLKLNDDTLGRSECTVCCEKKVLCIALPCRHCLCQECFQKSEACPFDRENIELIYLIARIMQEGPQDVVHSGGIYKKAYDDTLNQSMVQALVEQMSSVGILVSRDAVGTVFRVGSRHVMTTFHMVQTIIDRCNFDHDTFKFSDDTCGTNNFTDDTYVTFQPENRSSTVSNKYKLKNHFLFNKELDVALLEISNPVDLPVKMNLCITDIDEMGIQSVSLIGSGQEKNKYLDPKCKIFHPGSVSIRSAQAWLQTNLQYYRNILQTIYIDPDKVDKGYQGYDHSSKIIVDCFLSYGASGAPALASNDDGTLQVVGFLTSGLPDFYYMLPEKEKNLFPKKYCFQLCTKIKDILDWLNKMQLQELVEDLFGKDVCSKGFQVDESLTKTHDDDSDIMDSILVDKALAGGIGLQVNESVPRTKTDDNDSDDLGYGSRLTEEKSHNWSTSISTRDEDLARQLLAEDILPGNDELQMAFTEFGNKSPIMKYICEHIEEWIINLSENVVDVKACYKFGGPVKIVFVVFPATGRHYELSDKCQYPIEVHRQSSHEANEIIDFELHGNLHFDKNEMDRISHCLRDESPGLMDKHSNLNMTSASHFKSSEYGYGNRRVKTTCIVFYVSAKGFIPVGEDILPPEIGSLQTDVREGRFVLYGGGGPGSKHKNIKIGCRVSCSETYGTVGGFVQHPTFGLCAMTCAHVLLTIEEFQQLYERGNLQLMSRGQYMPGREESPWLSRECYQPGEPDRMGTLVDAKACPGDKENAGLDIAFVQVEKSRHPVTGRFPDFKRHEQSRSLHFRETFNESKLKFADGSVYERTEIPSTNMVIKYGATTTFTAGALQVHGSSVRPELSEDVQLQGRKRKPSKQTNRVLKYALHDQINIFSCGSDFSRKGDSGSLVMSMCEGNALVAFGILVGGGKDTKISFATPLSNILERIGLSRPFSLVPLGNEMRLENLELSVEELSQQTKKSFDVLSKKIDDSNKQNSEKLDGILQQLSALVLDNSKTKQNSTNHQESTK